MGEESNGERAGSTVDVKNKQMAISIIIMVMTRKVFTCTGTTCTSYYRIITVQY